jgi:hypothetical protein
MALFSIAVCLFIIKIAVNRPQDLDRDVEARLDTAFRGTGCMTHDIFKDWLMQLDQAMEGRRIALLMDNAPGHGKMGDVELQNITIIRLPPNTTSVSQPLDAGIIMSSKVKYSRLMIPVVSHYRAEQNSVKAKIPRAPLWACLPTAWDNVSRSCVQNCFASVPTILAAMQETLKNAAKSEPDVELERLNGELAQIYLDRVRSLGKQNDYGVLAFLKTMSRKGPTIYIDKFIDIVAADSMYKGHFLPNYVPAMAVGYDSCSDYSEDDDEYQPAETAQQEDAPSQRTMSRRSGQYTVVIPEELPSSQEVSLSQEVPSEGVVSSQEEDDKVRGMKVPLKNSIV